MRTINFLLFPEDVGKFSVFLAYALKVPNRANMTTQKNFQISIDIKKCMILHSFQIGLNGWGLKIFRKNVKQTFRKLQNLQKFA